MSNRPLSAGSERLVAPPVRKMKPPSPASRPHSATSRPPSELRAGEVARVEYSGVPPRFSDPYARPSAESRPMSARSHTSLRSVSSVGSYELPPKPIISWGPGKPSPHEQGLPRRGAAPHVTGSSGAKAFKGLHDAMGESAWLDEKFRRSGAPEPEEGALTVVIEYCWNGDEPQESQMSTVHDLKRYHEEAMLTAAYIRRICPEAVVATIPSNFRGEPVRTRGEPKRLGAFEVDARFRVDGELQQTSLWSKLHTLQWPQWPAWQDVIRQSLSVFKLVLRPVAVLADGSEAAVSETRLTVYNHNRSQVLLSCMVASGGGAQIKLLRGSYIVSVDETHDSYSEETSLTLTKVVCPMRGESPAYGWFVGGHVESGEAPLLSYEDIDIKVPIFMRPKLFVRLVTDWTADPPTGKPCPLGVSNCTATAMDVLFTVIDRSKAHNGDVLLQRRGPAQGLTSVLDLKQFRARVASMHTDLADQLWRASELGKHYGTPASLGASATGRSPGTAQAGISHLGDATGCTERPCGSANATMASAEEASVADVLSDVKSGLAQADLGWMVEVIATLPDFSHVMLDERLASTRVQLTKGGAPEVPLRLCRLTREVDVTVTAVQTSGAWCRTLALPSMSIVARLASGGPPILRTAAEPAPLDGGDAPGQTMLARFPAGLEVGETYVISAEAATESADAAALHEVSEQVLVHPGNGPVVVQLLAERMCGSLLIEWLSFNMGLDHWTTKLPLPEGFVYNIRHQGSDTMVMSGRFSGALGAVASTEIPGAGIIFVGETYTIEISPGSGVQAQKVSAFVSSSAPTPVQVTLHRATAPVHVHLRSDMSSSGSWASTLPLPPGVVFEVWHSALQKRVFSGHVDAKGYALIPDKEDLFINQRYEIRAIESDLVCASSIEFIVNEAQAAVELLVPRRTVDINLESSVAASEHWAAPLLPPAGLTLRLIHKATKEVALIAESDAKAKVKLNGVNAIFVGEMYTLEAPADSRVKAASVDFIASKKADQVIKFAVDRTTSDVTLAVVARHPSGLPDYDRELGAPSGLKYDVCHKALGVQVATGYTDAVGKSVLRRKGTLFVGETYTIKVAGESSMQSGSCEFTVAPHHIETTLYVQRASADLSYEIVSVLAGSNHWAASLPIPATIPFEGETYRLCVAANELFEKSSAEFHVAPGGARCLLHLQRSFASVDVILKSVHAGTNHWAADLPLPTAVPFRVVHARLGVVVASGSTNVASRATFSAEGGEFLVGESYRIDVVSSDAVTNSDEATFSLQSRATEVTKLVRRCCGRIEVGCRPGRASSGHWSSRVPLPDGISFNIYHKSLGCVVASGATSSSNHDSSPIKEEDALFVGETYICEVPKSNHVRAASREFKVTVEPQHVAVLVERACGQAVVHLNTSASLPVPEGTHLQLKHKGLDIAVLPPISVQGDRTELFGDDALLVGELYTLEALPHSSLLHSATEFMVLNQPFRIDLALERATGAVVLVFRSTGSQANGNASMPRHGAVHWTNSLTLPAGVRYEVTHKGTGVVVVSGCTHHAEKCHRIVLDSSLLYVHEAYGLRVLPVHGVQAASCEFFVESTESQEVTLLLRRSTAPVSVSFHSIEFSSDHWAASLPLPSNVRFQLLHHETGAVVHKGDAGPSNRVAIPSTLMFIGEKYTLQTVESTLIRRAAFDFVVRGGTDEQDVAVPIERNVGDAQVILHSADGRALPLGVPFQIRHCNLGCVVSEGRSTISDSRVVIDHWYVDQGALYVGEQYELTVPTGNGIKEATTIFVVDDKRVTVEMALTREHGQASVLLVNSKARSGHWSELLPLPKDMLLCVKLASNPDVILGSIHAQHAGLQQELLVSLTPDVDLMAHERYTIELQPSLPMLRSASELTIQSGDTPAVTELAVVRAWKPAVVVELRSSDAVALPAGLRIRIFHRDLRVEVAQADTEFHDVQVHCVVKASEAFFLGEPYVVSVESNYGVGAAEREFVMTQARAKRGNFGGGPDLCIELPRAAAQLWAVLFASLPSAEHWSSALTLPPQQLEVLHDKQLVYNSTVAWHKGDKEASCHISALTRVFVGHTYTIRVSESDAVHPLALPFVVDEGEKIAELPLRRKFFNLIVTLRSRDELPLPYGIKVLVRHKKLDTVVVSGMCGENEGSTFEDELEEAHAAHATLSAEQTAQAIEEVKSFMANNGVFFNGASDEDIESVTQAWSVHHTLRELREQNERTLDGIAAIMRDYENIALEVLGHTSDAQTATEALARFFGLDEYHDVEEIMNLLAEKRAEACRDALVERGVPYERLIVTFAGQSGAVRTDFIPCSMHNNAKLAMAATKLMRAQSKQGSIVFHAAVETRLSSASQAFTLEHMDPTILAQNRRTLENVAAVMMRYPHLQLHVHVETEAPATAPPILLHHFRLPASGGEDVTLAAMELLAGSRANAIVEALRSLGLHKGRVVGSCVGCAARASVTFTARTLEWRRNVFKHMDQSGGTSTAVALPESEQLGELAAQRSRVVFIKGIFNGSNTNYAAIHRPTSLSVRLDAPEALYPGEEYVVETIPAPSLGVPRVSREFLMPSHNEKLELWLERPFGSVNVVLIDSKYGSNHWASSLPMPSSATIRVRHHSIGLVLPETEIQGSALVAHAPSKGEALGLVTKQHPQTIAIQMADRYNLEVIESDELAGTQVEFEVEFVDEQPVHVFVARKWRDLQVHVRYVEEMALLVPPVGLEIVARHKDLKIEASRGVTGEMGICNIPGADALFVGETYLLDLANDEGVSLKTTEVTIPSGTLPLVLDVKLGPAAAHITVVVEEAWHGDRSMYQGKLGIPSEVTFEIYSSPRLEKPKVQGTTNSKGVCELGRAAQLYVGREYIIEVTKDPAVEPFSKTFDVHPGKQEIKVQLKRACGPVTAVFMMQLAEDPSHWASSMALPWPISYRVVHKDLGLTVHTGELPKTSAQTHRMQLPSEGVLFANETYSIEVGFQAKDEVLEAEGELRDSLRGRSLTFNFPDEISLPAIEHAWSVEHLLDHRDYKENQAFLDTVASIMRAYECIHLEVFSEGEIVQVAPYRLAAYYKLDPVQDAQIIMEHLCRNRASACVDALRMRGVEHSRLRTRHSARGSTSRTIFTPVLPDGPFFIGDQRTGLALTSVDFTVQRVPQDVVLRLAKSTGDMHIHFKSAYSEDPKHWSHSLQMPSGVRLRVMHTQRKVEVANGVVSGGGCFIAGAGKLFVNEHYTVLLDESPFFTQSPSTVMLRQGMQSVPILVTWQARHVVCYLTSAERGARRQTLEDEAFKRVEQFMLNREIFFNGAREAGLPSISQAWNVNHLDQDKCKQNLETLRGLANILLDYKDLKCRVHGDTGDAEEAPRGLAEHFKLHHQRNVQEIMDLLARKRAESCRQALIQLGVPASQLFVTAKGRGGHLSVRFLPADGDFDQMDALGQSIELQDNLLALPRGVPYRMRLKSSGQIIFEGVTEMSGVVVSCPLPKSERFFVSQEYVFEALAGPGTEPNSVEFFLDPRQVGSPP
ncbi:hypothetical protein AB1Y20_004524 [Prymnesium parvum]|uniref:OmpA-like domain-containing protein n=1 Tax=Prymnesium parvum TaxID=97485 RepID=A0AB34J0I3_PRYPA